MSLPASITAALQSPDNDFVWIASDDTIWFAFDCKYSFAGRDYVFRIWATSSDDAAQRLAAIKATAYCTWRTHLFLSPYNHNEFRFEFCCEPCAAPMTVVCKTRRCEATGFLIRSD
jgi:hypothetical protein